MKTFNGNQELKDELLKKLKHHEELDAFVQGRWLTDKKVEGNGFKGCFYGCTMQTNERPREAFSEKYNVDLWYCYITEKIFEGLPGEESKSFPYKSIEILPVGYDFNKLKSAFNKAVLLKQLEWVKDENVREVLINTSKLFDVPFNEISESAARSAIPSSYCLSWSYSDSKAWSAARSAVELSANFSAFSVKWSADSARSAEGKNHYIWLRDTLFELIKQN